MINKIVVKNVNAIELAEIDFKKNSYKFLEDNLINDIVNPVAIYGHNGSGKSSFLSAFRAFIWLMTLPTDNLAPFVVNDFLFQEYLKNPVTKYLNSVGSIELDFEMKGIIYTYYLSTSSERKIEEEYLKCGKKYLFNRKKSNVTIENKKVNIMQYSSLVPYLRILASEEVDNETIQCIYAYLSSFTFVDLPKMGTQGGFVASKLFNNVQTLDLVASKSEEVKELLKSYDEFPVYSVIKSTDNSNNFGNILNQYYLVFEGMEDKKLPLTFMSDGMTNQSILLSLILSMPNDSIIFIDELERALHPSALESFIEIVKKKKIQLVFSSHNTSILQTLRPDQVYFAKWKNGFSNMYRLSKIYPAIREVNNIEKMYLSGLFSVED